MAPAQLILILRHQMDADGMPSVMILDMAPGGKSKVAGQARIGGQPIDRIGEVLGFIGDQ